jgi:tetratricopeptide (TPR) repeat protein
MFSACLGVSIVLSALSHAAVQDAPTPKKSKDWELIEKIDQHLPAIMRTACPIFPNFDERRLELFRIDFLDAIAEALLERYQAANAINPLIAAFQRLDALASTDPNNHDVRLRIAINKRCISRVQVLLGRVEAAVEPRRFALEVTQKLISEAPKDTRFQTLLARLLVDQADLVERDPQQAEQSIADYRKAIEIWQPIVAAAPKEHAHQIALAYAWNGLGMAYLFLARFRESADAFTKSHSIREKLTAELPDQAFRWVELAGSTCNLGNVIVENRGKLEDALVYFDKGIVLLERALKLDANVRDGRVFLSNCYWGKFLVSVRTKKFAEADAASNKALEFMQGYYRLDREIHREREFAEAGDYERAVKRIEQIAKRKDIDAVLHYRLATVYAAAVEVSKARDEPASEYARRAVIHLRQFHTGSKYTAAMTLRLTDDDKMLDPLRKREAFLMWIKELREAPAPKPKDVKPN